MNESDKPAKPDIMSQPDFLSLSEVAAIFGISAKSVVRNETLQKALIPTKSGKRLYRIIPVIEYFSDLTGDPYKLAKALGMDIPSQTETKQSILSKLAEWIIRTIRPNRTNPDERSF